MNAPPRVDVLFPVYRARHGLDAALDDLLAERGVELRVLAVVDTDPDGTDDGSRARLAERAAADPRVELLQGRGRGAADALQLGLDHARAPLLAHMEADDRSAPDRLARLAAALRPELDAVTSAVRLTGRATPGMRRYVTWQNGLVDHAAMARERFLEIPALHQTGLYRTDAVRAVGGYVSRGPWPVDIDFWFRWFEHDRPVTKLPEPLYAWHQHPAQSTRSGGAHGRASLRAAKRHALLRHLRARVGGVPALHLLGRGRALRQWRRELEADGLPPRTVREWAPDSTPAPLPLPRDGLLLAVYGMPHDRERVRAALGAPPEPERLLFTA